jgi:GrpB-like predicted nucleotidyltransferase (UPF0157 family)
MSGVVWREEVINLLGLPKGKVSVVLHNSDWARLFEIEKRLLSDSLSKEVNHIEHIGSTSIYGIDAKPIIDILIGIDTFDRLKYYGFEELKSVGYYKLKVLPKGKIVFAKFSNLSELIKTHILHVVLFNGEIWSKLIQFRDYLNDNTNAAREYEMLKRNGLRSILMMKRHTPLVKKSL